MKKGFTLIEVILAISILTIGASAAWVTLQKILTFTQPLPSRLIATYLLQEGLEIARNVRDKGWIEGKEWGDGIPNGERQADYKSVNLAQNYSDESLNIDANGFYSHSPGTPTRFKRKFIISKPTSYIIEVVVEVSWEERGKTHTISGQLDLYNSYQE